MVDMMIDELLFTNHLDKCRSRCKNEGMRMLIRTAILMPVVCVVTACESRPSSKRGDASSCGTFPSDSSYAVSALKYIERLQPQPRRFLNAVTTDSALPPKVFEALQQKGPGYLFPPNPSDRAKVLDKLTTVGPWAALLVTWKGAQLLDSEHGVIRLGGHFIVVEEGQAMAPRRAIHFTCENGNWTYSRTVEEKIT